MILSDEYLQKLLQEALQQVPVPRDCAVVLEGSIAEGFGNESSDIDFLVITDSDELFPGTPTVLFIDGRKVDVRVRSTREVRADVERVVQLHQEGRQVSANLLNRCQRLSRGFPLTGQRLIDSVQSVISPSQLEAAVSAHFDYRAREAAKLAFTMLVLGQTSVAANWARTALAHAAKSWAAKHGETYLEGRWIFQQMNRIEGGEDVLAIYRTLAPSGRSKEALTSYVSAVLNVLPDLGVEGCDPDPDDILLDRQVGITSWQIHSTVHVLRGRQDVFALNHDAAKVWRKLVFGMPLPTVLARIDSDRAESGRLIADFHALGLVRLRWRGGTTIDAVSTSLSPSAERPLLSVGGAVFADENEPIKLLPIPARRFAAAGMALSWGNVMVESVRQDAVGAIASQQWGVFEIVARRLLCHACLAILSAHGVDPLPPPEQVCDRLRSIHGLDKALLDAVDELEWSIPTEDEPHAAHVLGKLDALTEQMRAITGTGQFPVSFGGTEAWRETLKGFFDWVRIGAYLDAPFPREDLRDLLQPVQPVNSRPATPT
jgi:hypothetical protein